MALATACGSQTSGTDTDSNAGTQSGAQQEESTLTGKLDEKKDFMFVVTDDQGASYQFSIDSSAKPEGYDDVAVGDSVTVTARYRRLIPLRAQSLLWRKLNDIRP